MTNQLLGLEFCAVQQDIFYPHPDYEQVIFCSKNRVFITLVGPSETGKRQLIYNWLKFGTFQLEFDKIYFFYKHSQPLYDVMQKESENLEFVQGKNFEFIDSFKKTAQNTC